MIKEQSRSSNYESTDKKNYDCWLKNKLRYRDEQLRVWKKKNRNCGKQNFEDEANNMQFDKQDTELNKSKSNSFALKISLILSFRVQ